MKSVFHAAACCGLHAHGPGHTCDSDVLDVMLPHLHFQVRVNQNVDVLVRCDHDFTVDGREIRMEVGPLTPLLEQAHAERLVMNTRNMLPGRVVGLPVRHRSVEYRKTALARSSKRRPPGPAGQVRFVPGCIGQCGPHLLLPLSELRSVVRADDAGGGCSTGPGVPDQVGDPPVGAEAVPSRPLDFGVQVGQPRPPADKEQQVAARCEDAQRAGAAGPDQSPLHGALSGLIAQRRLHHVRRPPCAYFVTTAYREDQAA